MYAIQATVTREIDGWSATRQVPTFYLYENVQGIVSTDHAAKIARSIIDPFDLYEVHVTAVYVLAADREWHGPLVASHNLHNNCKGPFTFGRK